MYCSQEHINTISIFDPLGVDDDGQEIKLEDLLSSEQIDYNDKIEFEVLSGKGYGIIDDCGGVWGLGDIFSGEDTDWGEYDINDFDLDECNENVKKV